MLMLLTEEQGLLTCLDVASSTLGLERTILMKSSGPGPDKLPLNALKPWLDCMLSNDFVKSYYPDTSSSSRPCAQG